MVSIVLLSACQLTRPRGAARTSAGTPAPAAQRASDDELGTPPSSAATALAARAGTAPPFRRTLTLWQQPEQGWAGYALHLADVSGDGRADLVWNHLADRNRTYVALSNGDGTFRRALTAWVQPEQGWAGYTADVVEVNGDGRADLVWNHLADRNRTYVALSNGDGTFRRALTAWVQPEQGWAGYTLRLADVSGDGRADLIWNHLANRNRTYVALSNGNGTFRRALTAWDQAETGWAGYTVSVADVNGDGRADLVWNHLADRNRTYVALSNGDGTFRRAPTAWVQPEQGWAGYTLRLADVSGDGRADLIWNHLADRNRTYVALANADGTFRRALTAWDQAEMGWAGYTVSAADVNGDGRADLVWNHLADRNRTYVAVSRGDGSFDRVVTAWDQAETGWGEYRLSVADVTGDRKADLLWSELRVTNRTYCSVSELEGADQTYDLDVAVRGQDTGMWCWAASTQMAMRFLGVEVAQCEQANYRFDRTDCCTIAMCPSPEWSGPCVQGGWPDLEHWGFSSTVTAWGVALSYDQLVAEMAGSRPVLFAWGWEGGGGHLMVARGVTRQGGIDYVHMNDPWPPCEGGHRLVTYEEFVAREGIHMHWRDFYELRRLGGVEKASAPVAGGPREESAPGPSFATAQEAAAATLRQLGKSAAGSEVTGLAPGKGPAPTLGEPLREMIVRLDELGAFTRGGDPGSLLHPTDGLLLPVLAGDDVMTAVTVKKVAEGYRTVAVGDAFLAQALAKSSAKATGAPPAERALVRVPALRMVFEGRRDQTGWTLVPLLDDPRFRFKAGQPLPAATVLERLAPTARATPANVPGE